MDFHALRNYKIVSVLIKELLILVGVLRPHLLKALHIFVCRLMASNNTSTFTLRSVLEKEKLNGTNFLDWSRNLRIVLKQERKMYVLDNEIPDEPPANNAPRAERDAYSKHLNDYVDVTCLMLT